MEWNLKHPLQWDWENLALFYDKESEISRSIKQAEWIAEGGINSNGTIYSSGSGTCSGSVVGNGSSNNSITASVGSSSKAGNNVPEANIEIIEGFLENQNNNYDIDQGKNERVSAEASCTGAGEPLIGLKLGKRTYFENLASSDIKTSSAVCLLPPASVKSSSLCHQSIQHPYCQVEGCNLDLTTAKEYHRKHRVCESHSKSPKVIVSGHERRFCQQCSRFHDLSEFDQKKRSCRRRLSEHNARRRKPQPDTLSFHPAKLTSAFYGQRQQMDFFPNLAPFSNLRSSTSCLRNESNGFSLSMAKGSWIKPTKMVGDGQLHLPLMDFSNVDTPSCNDLNKLMPLKCGTTEVFNQGLEAPALASNLNRAPDLHRALSLLSSDAWIPPSTAQGDVFQLGSLVSAPPSHPIQVNSVPECWQQDEHSLTFNIHSSGSQAQELNQLFSASNGHFLEFRS